MHPRLQTSDANPGWACIYLLISYLVRFLVKCSSQFQIYFCASFQIVQIVFVISFTLMHVNSLFSSMSCSVNSFGKQTKDHDSPEALLNSQFLLLGAKLLSTSNSVWRKEMVGNRKPDGTKCTQGSMSLFWEYALLHVTMYIAKIFKCFGVVDFTRWIQYGR